MNKIGIFLSIFSNDNIENSISYITKLCLNIKSYNDFYINNQNVDVIINTDEFTYKIIVDICRQEKISLDNVIFHKHRRNSGLRGMFWRFESFYADEYDIAICAEGDYDLSKYSKEIEYFETTKFDLLLHSVRQIKISLNCFAGGRIFIHPKNISLETKNKIKHVIELFDHIDDIDYGVDEYYLISLLKKHFYDKNILIVSDNRLNIKNAVKDINIEINNIKECFPKATVLSIQEYEALIKEYTKYVFNTYDYLSYHIKTVDDKLCYCIYGQCLKIKQPFRINRSEFCQERLLKLVNDII